MAAHLCDFPGCLKSFPKLWRLREHQCSAHTRERPFLCKEPGCGKSFIRAYHLKRHNVSHLTTKPEFRCTYDGCNRVYSLLQNLRKHEKTHKNPLPYTCDVSGCERAFKKHSQLHIHKSRHSGDVKPFRCSEDGCTAGFFWPSELRKHKKSHKEYTCPAKNCDVVCRRWTDMREHASSHSVVHGCKLCGKTFKKRNLLKIHSRMHSDNRCLLVCDWESCGRTYTTVFNLDQHVRAFHFQEKPFKCSLSACSSVFSTKVKERSKTYPKMFPWQPKVVDHCLPDNVHRQSLKRHIRTHHTDSVKPAPPKRKSVKRPLSSQLSGYEKIL